MLLLTKTWSTSLILNIRIRSKSFQNSRTNLKIIYWACILGEIHSITYVPCIQCRCHMPLVLLTSSAFSLSFHGHLVELSTGLGQWSVSPARLYSSDNLGGGNKLTLQNIFLKIMSRDIKIKPPRYLRVLEEQILKKTDTYTGFIHK